MLTRLLRRRGRLHPDPDILRHNLSFVLHERSNSDAVALVARRCLRHATRIDHLSPAASLPSTIDAPAVEGERDLLLLTAAVGVPQYLIPALEHLDLAVRSVVAVDDPDGPHSNAEFFRAPAQLRLPGPDSCRVIVAALVLRPESRTTHLHVAGLHHWPGDSTGALRSVERLIQAYADQWTPPRQLWRGPAEELLPDEIR